MPLKAVVYYIENVQGFSEKYNSQCTIANRKKIEYLMKKHEEQVLTFGMSVQVKAMQII